MEDSIVQGLKAQLTAIEAEREALAARRHKLWLAANRLRKILGLMGAVLDEPLVLRDSENSIPPLAFPEAPITNAGPPPAGVGHRILGDPDEDAETAADEEDSGPEEEEATPDEETAPEENETPTTTGKPWLRRDSAEAVRARSRGTKS